MSDREHIPTWLRERVLSRDEYRCKKCGNCSPSVSGLQLHHVREVVYGGANTLDNLHTLCDACHAEWTFCDISVPYEEWLTLLPARVIASLMATRFPSELNARDFLALSEVAFAQLQVERMLAADWSPVIDKWTPRRPRKQKR